MLEQSIRIQLEQYLKLLESDISIHFFKDSSASSQELSSLLNEIQSLGQGKIELKTIESGFIPVGFSIGKKSDKNHRIIFKAVPMGHEFSTLIMALLQVSGRKPKISSEEYEQLHQLVKTFKDQEIKVQSYISLSCHNCPDVVQVLNMVAIHCDTFTHEIIDGALYTKEVEDLGIMAVPSIYHEKSIVFSGKKTFSEIIEILKNKFLSQENLQQEKDLVVERLNSLPLFDQLIIGGGPSGASAAIYSARKGLNVAIVSPRFGGQVLDTLGIENYLSMSYTEGPKLVREMENHVKENGVPIINDEMLSSEKIEGIFHVHLKSGAVIKAKSVILSTGAHWRELNIPGEKEFKNKGVAYCPHCDGPLFKGKKVIVVGGGNSGVEAAIDLAGIVEHVTLLEYAPNLKADKVLQDKLHQLPNTRVITNVMTKSILGDDKVNAVEIIHRENNHLESLDCSGIFVQIGLSPNTKFKVSDGDNQLELNRFGEIVVDHKNKTNIAGLFAAGDCTTAPFKQIIIAVGDGAKASLSAFEYLSLH